MGKGDTITVTEIDFNDMAMAGVPLKFSLSSDKISHALHDYPPIIDPDISRLNYDFSLERSVLGR